MTLSDYIHFEGDPHYPLVGVNDLKASLKELKEELDLRIQMNTANEIMHEIINKIFGAELT